ncbi:MAG: response regulator [Thaumarchaeota archaeon]|nr:response regulator [Nitrososphaerota archaeon]
MSIITTSNRMLSVQPHPILIIEDSLAIVMLMKEYLNALGYYDIQTASAGKEGMQLFENLVKANTFPIVFLDYNLPDVDANVVLPHILKIKPETKIIIATALEKGEQEVKDVIMHGAYLYLQKPIRFDNIQNVIKILEDEFNAAKEQTAKVKEQIDSILKPTFVTLNRIAELCNTSGEKALDYLKELESTGKVISLNNVEETSCSNCGSVLIEKDSNFDVSNGDYHCLRCNKRFEASKAKKIMTKAFRIKAKYNFQAGSTQHRYSY